MNGGTITGTGVNAASSGNIALGGNSFLAGTGSLNLSGVISGGFDLTQNGTLLSYLSGNNSYTGTTTINGGSLGAQHINALGTTAGGTVVNSGAYLYINNVAIGNEAVALNNASVVGTGAGASLSGTVTLTGTSFVNAAGTLIVNGQVTGTGSLNKGDVGTIILTNAANNYSGVTNIFTGTLQAGVANAVAATDMTISSGAVFNLNNFRGLHTKALYFNSVLIIKRIKF